MGVVPTLSDDGYINNSKLKLLRAFSYFLIADHSQSDLYRDGVVSLKYLIEQYTGKDEELNDAFILTLKNYLLTLFKTVDIKISDSETDDVISKNFDIMTIDENDNSNNLSVVIKIKNSNIINLDEILEYLNKQR